MEGGMEMCFSKCDSIDATTCEANPSCVWYGDECRSSACSGIAHAYECLQTEIGIGIGTKCIWNYRRDFCSHKAYEFEAVSTELPALSECATMAVSTNCLIDRDNLTVEGGSFIAATPQADGQPTCDAGDQLPIPACMHQVHEVIDSFPPPPGNVIAPYNHVRCEKYLPQGISASITFTPGVYCAAESLFTTEFRSYNHIERLEFDALGDPNARFIIVAGRFILKYDMVLSNGAQASNIFWVGRNVELQGGPNLHSVGTFLMSDTALLNQMNLTGQILMAKRAVDFKVIQVSAASHVKWAVCVVSEWEDDAPCSASCGVDAHITQTRHVVVDAPICPPLVRNATCHGPPCPVDCVLSEWVNDGPCSASCGQGVQNQTRVVLSDPAYEGAACPLELIRSVSCNTTACDTILPTFSADDAGTFWTTPTIVAVSLGGVVVFAACVFYIIRGCTGNGKKMTSYENV